MCTVILPPGVNPTAVNKHVDINISGFLREVAENCAVLVCYAAIGARAQFASTVQLRVFSLFFESRLFCSGRVKGDILHGLRGCVLVAPSEVNCTVRATFDCHQTNSDIRLRNMGAERNHKSEIACL